MRVSFWWWTSITCVCLCVGGEVKLQTLKELKLFWHSRLLKRCSTCSEQHTHVSSLPRFPYLVVKLVIEKVFPQSVRKVEDSCNDDTERTKKRDRKDEVETITAMWPWRGVCHFHSALWLRKWSRYGIKPFIIFMYHIFFASHNSDLQTG